MSILDLKNMTIAQKFMAMEELWEDMSKNADSKLLTPNWHLEELNQREEKLQKGEAMFYRLEDIKKEFKSFK
jgi:hypothetical protein